MAQRLRNSIEELARDDRRFPPEAYMLVFDGLEAALAKLDTRRHVSPDELVEGVLDRAVDRWGMLARAVLDDWNVHTGADIGDMVFNLVDRRLLVASESDTRAEFAVAGPLTDDVEETFLAHLERHPPRVTTRD